MSKKKGLSLEEKRDRMLEIFHSSADVFVLKDVEKLSVKKGIISQSVKDVLQSLVDDDLVHQEKIGSSNYFWAFPAEASVKLENELKTTEEQLAQAQASKKDLGNRVQHERKGKQESENRAAKMAKLRELQTKVKQLQNELEQYRENDPETVEAWRQATVVSRDAANRWLDNIYCLKQWCKKQFPNMDEELNKFFAEQGLTDTMEYID